MIMQGMPWPLVLPIAIMALTYGIMASQKEMKNHSQSGSSKRKKQ